MTAADLHRTLPPAVRPSFFATPWPWLAHAAAWTVVLLAVNTVAYVLYVGPGFAAFAIVTGFVSSRLLGPVLLDVRFAEAARFALVDAVLVMFVAGLLYPVASALLRGAGVENDLYAVTPGVVALAGYYVPLFYASLWGAGALHRRGDAWRHSPAPFAAVAALALAWTLGQQSAALLAQRTEVAEKIAQYEAETGKPGDAVRSEISLSLHGFYGRPSALAVDPQGRVVVAGNFTFYGAHEVHGFARLERDGRLDRTWSSSALEAATGGLGLLDLRPRSDGALLVAVPDPTGTAPPSLRTLQPDGTLDDRPGVAVTGNVYDGGIAPLDVRADGVILVGRASSPTQNEPPACVRRFLADGSEDLAFTATVGRSLDSNPGADLPSCSVSGVLALPDGKTLVVLSAGIDGNTWRDGLLRRLDANGNTDTAFRSQITGVIQLAASERGEVFVATLSTGGPVPEYALVKLRDDGMPDEAFAPPADLPNADALAVQRDGRVLIAGRSRGIDYAVARVLADGHLDATFGAAGSVPIEFGVHRIAPTDGGDIYLLGDFMNVGVGKTALRRYQIARLLADGTPDPTFDPR